MLTHIKSGTRAWPAEGLTRVPYWVYQDEDVYRQELERIFLGPNWHFLCLEAELPDPGCFRTTHVGEMPVVVARDAGGVLRAFENRCAHRGALICPQERGRSERFVCVYHNWTYDLAGNLAHVAFRNGIGGKGGMAPDACPESQAPRQLRVASFCGLAFGTLSAAAPALEDWIGPAIAPRVRRVMAKGPLKPLGGYTQLLHNNWKLYAENVRDTYHASLLHLFYTRFRINRLTQRGGLLVSEDGGHHTTYTLIDAADATDAYEREQTRSAGGGGFRLEAPQFLEQVDELGDGVAIQILSLYPGFVLQQIKNSLAVRWLVPRGVGRTELHWACFGFAGDDEAMTERRLRQANLIGPAGYISMEDGAATAYVQRGVQAAAGRASVVAMGGDAAASGDSRITEAAVRGFWKAWRRQMEL